MGRKRQEEQGSSRLLLLPPQDLLGQKGVLRRVEGVSDDVLLDSPVLDHLLLSPKETKGAGKLERATEGEEVATSIANSMKKFLWYISKNFVIVYETMKTMIYERYCANLSRIPNHMHACVPVSV